MTEEAKAITDSIFNELWAMNEGFRRHWERETGLKEGQGTYGVNQVLHSMAAYLSSVLNPNCLKSSSKAGKRAAPKRNEMDEVNDERKALIQKVQHMLAKRTEAIKAAKARFDTNLEKKETPAVPPTPAVIDLEKKETPSAVNPNVGKKASPAGRKSPDPSRSHSKRRTRSTRSHRPQDSAGQEAANLVKDKKTTTPRCKPSETSKSPSPRRSKRADSSRSRSPRRSDQASHSSNSWSEDEAHLRQVIRSSMSSAAVEVRRIRNDAERRCNDVLNSLDCVTGHIDDLLAARAKKRGR